MYIIVFADAYCFGERCILIHPFDETHSIQWAKTWKIVHFGRTMYCLHQRLKSTFFEIFSSGGSRRKKYKNIFDFSLWGNCATTQTHIWSCIFSTFLLIVSGALKSEIKCNLGELKEWYIFVCNSFYF